jgi:kynurenine 3-monooxygenase
VIHIVGAGPAGCLLAIMQARRGVNVLLYERREDPRTARPDAGRSINLALAARGLRALRAAGVMPRIAPLLVPLRGRRVHENGATDQFIPYGQREHEVIWSVSRAALTSALADAARELSPVQLQFGMQCMDYLGDGCLRLRDTATQRERDVETRRIVAADGAGSVLRQALALREGFTVTEARLPHDYKEVLVPLKNGGPQLAMDALHIWPRGNHMLIALPNADGTFTATLFLSRSANHATGEPGFDTLQRGAEVEGFFEHYFPDFARLVPDLTAQFDAHPQGLLGTVYCPRWRDGERLLLIGDAAHAIVPFHGQGMNCAFEDCAALDSLLAEEPAQAFARFESSRREDCLAIAQMALENYGEMRDTVRSPMFQRQKQLSLLLERAHPDRFIPRYAMVMFHDEIPYSVALRRGRVQQQILDELTAQPEDAAPEMAAALINARLGPLSFPAR